MARIAADIALILPDELVGRAIEINRRLVAENPENIVLGAEGSEPYISIPHISLCVGVIERRNLPRIKETLDEIASNSPIISSSVVRLQHSVNTNRPDPNSLIVARTKYMQTLHKRLVNEMRPFLYENAAPEDFIFPSEINDLTLYWTTSYEETSAFKKFNPHISIGFGDFQGEIEPFKFTASKIAIYQMGNYCTCRKKIDEFELTG